KGAVIAVANAYPKLCASLYKAYKRGSYEKAAKLQRIATRINEVLVKRFNQLSAIKEVMRILGLPGGYPRMPILPLGEVEKAEIKSLLEAVKVEAEIEA
ncbi:MAG: dihydrodipicolinate synthase family protein, partial [Candidatus Bathyarchaeia archaeon]